MKTTKMLGLAMVAALATMAFAAVGTASANHEVGHEGKHSALCIDEPIQDEQQGVMVDVCEGEAEAVQNALIQGEDQPAEQGVLKAEGDEIKCDTNTFQADVGSVGVPPEQQIKGQIIKLDFGGANPQADCDAEGTCKDVEDIRTKGGEEKGSVQLEWEQKEQPQGHAQIEGVEVEVELENCTFFQVDNIVCTFRADDNVAEGKLINKTAEKQAQIEIEAEPVVANPEQSNNNCPEAGTEDVGYQVQAESVETQDNVKHAGEQQIWLAKHQEPVA